MKRLAFLALLLAAPAYANTVPDTDIFVIDGDTVSVRSTGERIRLLDIDAAELSGCPQELPAAMAARLRVMGMIANRGVSVARSGAKDRYGRTLGRLSVNGVDIGDQLIRDGVAIRYRPGHEAWVQRRQHWCGGRK